MALGAPVTVHAALAEAMTVGALHGAALLALLGEMRSAFGERLRPRNSLDWEGGGVGNVTYLTLAPTRNHQD